VSGGGVPIQAPNPIGVTFESLNLFQLHRHQSPPLSAYTANTDPFVDSQNFPLCYFLLSHSPPRHASEKISENDFNKQTKTNHQLGRRQFTTGCAHGEN